MRKTNGSNGWVTEKAHDILQIHEQFHAEMIDKALGQLGLEENEHVE